MFLWLGMKEEGEKMMVLNEVKEQGKTGNVYVLIMDKREAQTLVEIVRAAHSAEKRRLSFRTWKKKIEECLECY
ncbi:hypothetical protein ES708_12452 [subsurface metagenome]